MKTELKKTVKRPCHADVAVSIFGQNYVGIKTEYTFCTFAL